MNGYLQIEKRTNKMRKTILTLLAGVFTLASANVFAQTEAGHGFVGAKSGLGFTSTKVTTKTAEGSNSSKPTNKFNLNLNGGYFVIDNLAIGGLVELDLTAIDTASTLEYVVAPKLTYFVPFDSQFRPYANFYAGYAGVNHSKSGSSENSNTGGLAIGGGIGCAYFLQSNIALSLELGYNSQSTEVKVGDKSVTTTAGAFAPSLGFSLFF